MRASSMPRRRGRRTAGAGVSACTPRWFRRWSCPELTQIVRLVRLCHQHQRGAAPTLSMYRAAPHAQVPSARRYQRRLPSMFWPPVLQKIETISPRWAYRMTWPPRSGRARRASVFAVTPPRYRRWFWLLLPLPFWSSCRRPGRRRSGSVAAALVAAVLAPVAVVAAGLAAFAAPVVVRDGGGGQGREGQGADGGRYGEAVGEGGTQGHGEYLHEGAKRSEAD